MKQRFSEEQVVQILREGEAAETKAEIWRQYGISEWTYYRWRQRYGGLAESQAKRLKHLEQENARLKRLVAEQALAAERRELVMALVARGISERLACRTVGLSRASYRYRGQPPDGEEQRLRALVVALARQHPRYGYRRVAALLRRQGRAVNHKWVWRVWREEGLAVPRRRTRKRRAGTAAALPTRATHRGHVWTYDFLFDATERGQALKLLVVLDEYTRECHRVRVGRRLDSDAVIDTLAALFEEHGPPEHLRSDNGSEFIAARLQAWLGETGATTLYIAPGHPWENGYAESFNGKLRDECLDEEVFWGVEHAQVIVERWRRQYNEERPHSALGYRTPAEVAGRAETPTAGGRPGLTS